MKFLMIVLAIHVIGELIDNKRKDKAVKKEKLVDENVHHPAETELR
jgi:hypothetical protein